MAEQIIQPISGITSGMAPAIRKRIVCLYRVSTVGQVEKDDIPMQKQYCREFCKQHPGWEIIKEFSEKGISGFKVSAKDRDAIQEIQKMALQNEFDILLVFMFDRLGRKDDETPFVVEWFVKRLNLSRIFGWPGWSHPAGPAENAAQIETHFDTPPSGTGAPTPARLCGLATVRPMHVH